MDIKACCKAVPHVEIWTLPVGGDADHAARQQHVRDVQQVLLAGGLEGGAGGGGVAGLVPHLGETRAVSCW